MALKQDSNLTGLRFAEEQTLRVLPSTPVFYPLEPNSYSDFGGQLATIARNPINASRQRKKGTITDLDASGGFNQDLTMNNLTRLLQGFVFANIRQKPSSRPMNGAGVDALSVAAATDKWIFSADPGAFLPGHVVKSSGYAVTANNTIAVVVSTDADDITIGAGLVDEASPPAAAKVEAVGFQFGSGTSAIALNGALVRLTDSGTDMTTLGLLPGEWLFVGDDVAGNAFANNSGFARIGVNGVQTGYLEFDKVSWEPAVEAGTGKAIRVYFGNIVRNEPDPANIVRRTYHVERTLGSDDDGVMSEYLTGAVPNELTLNVAQADKVTVDLTFVACDNEQRTGAQGVKAGTRPTMAPEEAINTTSDVSRIKLSLVSADASPLPLFAFATDLTLTINNNVTPNKAIGVLGAFDTSAGTFEVGGQLTAYFADIQAVQAVRNNADVTLDAVFVKDNSGILFDVPLLALGDGRLSVEQDQAITLPLETNAAESALGYTLAMVFFPYLPNAAA